MKVLKLSPENLEEVIRALKNGGVVVIPTDTIYGLVADARNSEALRRIFEIKGRPEEKSLPIFVASIEEAEKFAEINERQRKFLASVWPGKVTCVLRLRREVELPEGSSTSGNVALRVPKHDFALKLLKEFGGPLTGTSANLAGRPGHTKIAELLAEFENAPATPDLIIDAGNLLESLPSTVVDLTQDFPKILREGAVSTAEIMRYIEGL